MMKRRVVAFVLASALLLALLPALNLLAPSPLAQGAKALPWWHGQSLYRADAVWSWLGRQLYRVGISSEPTQALIGQSGWLFLGDLHGARLTRGRTGATAADEAQAAQIAQAQAAWAKWYDAHGVRGYRVLLAADKNTVYAEHLPGWARDSAPTAADVLMAHVPAATYVDTRPVLKRAQQASTHALYYQTDSHWNALGAWLGFKALMDNLARSDTTLEPVLTRPMHITAQTEYRAGDLSVLLRTAPALRDVDFETELAGQAALLVQQLDFNTGRSLHEGGNLRTGATPEPLLVKSPAALSARRVLWLRDSFGVAMSPYMAAAFAETLQVHYNAANAERLSYWVRSYKPDYVIVTIVERDAVVDWFKVMPPQ